MKKKFDRSLLLPRFKTEVRDHIHTLNKGFLALEKDSRDKQLIETLMRATHTLKGAACIAGFKRIADLAHILEEAIGKIEKGRMKVKEEHFNLLFQVLDTIPPLLSDKITWPDKGTAYPHVINLEKRLRKTFRLKDLEVEDEPALAEKTGPEPPAFTIEDSAEVIKVETGKLDRLVNLAGELVTSKINLDQKIRGLSEVAAAVEEFDRELAGPGRGIAEDILVKSEEVRDRLERLEQDFSRLARQLSLVSAGLQEGIMRTRMLPLNTLFSVFPRLVRDMSKQDGKSVQMDIQGGETELDRGVLQEMEAPLMHLVRNAVAHGIESPEARRDAGKPEAGLITLRARQQGSLVVIQVADDGGGIDVEDIKTRAIATGVLSELEAERMPAEQIMQVVFSPGFTTRDSVTQDAGRGVGLDVVRTNVARLKGQLEVVSAPGRGSTFTVKLPLTLAISTALMVKTSGQVFAIPLGNLEETIRITPEEIGSIESREAIEVRGMIIPLTRLDDLLRLKKKGIIERKYRMVAIVRAMEKRLALMVDEFLGKQEIVVKTLGDCLSPVTNIAGATILGTGEVSLILDVAALVESAALISGRAAVPVRPRIVKETGFILVVDDSLTTAQFERLVLESAGYRVAVAGDGREALAKLAGETPDLVVTDILMPGMNGFQLIEAMKKNDVYREIPVVIVTSKAAEADRRRGMELGADAYITKGDFDQGTLLETVDRIIG